MIGWLIIGWSHISFLQKLPSLHIENSTDDNPNRKKITVSDAEWCEVKQAVNDAFNNFVDRLQEDYPQLNEKDICFCCLVKINVNIQDLSDIYCVSKAAITKRKYRIKTEKMRRVVNKRVEACFSISRFSPSPKKRSVS